MIGLGLMYGVVLLVVSDGAYGPVALISLKDLRRSKTHLQGENVWTKASEMETLIDWSCQTCFMLSFGSENVLDESCRS